MKRFVRLKNRETGEVNSYPSIADLVRRNGEDVIGIGLQSLYNAVSSNGGRWENEKYAIYYDSVDLGNKEWK